MKELTKEEFAKIRAEWKAIRKSEKETDYTKFINPKVRRRYVMEKKANDIIHRNRNKRKAEILYMFRDEINENIKERSKRIKYIVKNGHLIFITDGDDNDE